MCANHGTASGTLFRGKEGLEDTLEGVTKMLAQAPTQLLSWQYSAAYKGAMRVLAGVRAQHPSLSLAPIVHGLPKRPITEASFWDVGAEAEYVAEACKLDRIIRRCHVEKNDS